MANGDPVLTSSGNIFLANGNPVLEGKTIAGVTCRLSLINEVAFLDNPSINLPLLVGGGYKITLSASGKDLIGWIKDVGPGESLDSELLSGWTNDGGNPFETFTASGSDITSAINAAGGYGVAFGDVFPAGKGSLYRILNTMSYISGNGCIAYLYPTAAATYQLLSGANTIYTTSVAATPRLYLEKNGAVQFSSNGNSIKKVLTPSASGITIVSASGGETREWTSDSGINPNAASFTLTVMKS